jgi:uncharacterized membrane protein YccC
MAAKHALLSAFTEVPYRPTGLTISDQALASLAEALQWCTTAISETAGHGSLSTGSSPSDRARLAQSREVLQLTAEMFDGGQAGGLEESVRRLDDSLINDSALNDLEGMAGDDHEALHAAFHSRLTAAASRGVGLDALVAARRISPADAVVETSRWLGQATARHPGSRHPLARAAGAVVGGHTSLHSIWFRNSARGAVALAAAVTVADVTNVQHGFWVVLGTLSVLRTNAASTGATALRALIGTMAGFFIGAGLILAIGSHTAALWVALPVAVLVAAYAPGTAPFAVGQAAFTVTISVLYNIIVPVGWKVGELRLEDVALGAAISAAVGAFFWPRGATRVVADDLADAFHAGGIYLVQATAWALGVRDDRPDGAAPVISAGARLDDALRAMLSEQGTQRVQKETMWRLVGGALRLRLMAHALAQTEFPHDHRTDDEARVMMGEAVQIAGLYDRLAGHLGHTAPTVAEELANVHLEGAKVPLTDSRVLWVRHHVDHLRRNLDDLTEPADTVARRLASPWWT